MYNYYLRLAYAVILHELQFAVREKLKIQTHNVVSDNIYHYPILSCYTFHLVED